jgi:N-carbamoylputrescine amidase
MSAIIAAALQTGPAAMPAHAFAAASPLLSEAAAAGARIAVLPELFAWPYFAGDDPSVWRGAAERPDGPTAAWAAAEACRTGMAIIVSLPLSRPGSLPANAVLLARPGESVEVVAHKIHLPPSGAAPFGEADHFAPGEPVVAVADAAGLKLAVLVCYDRRFPECWRAARAGGADLVCVPVAGPAVEPDGFFAAEMRTHARENGVYALSAVRCGEDRVNGQAVRHDGDTLAVRPDGSVAARRQQSDGPGLVLLAVETDALAEARARSATFDNRRPVRAARLPGEDAR